MKASRFSLFFLFLLTCQSLFAQSRLSITSITGFPTSGSDSAFYNIPYDSIVISIKNTGTVSFAGEADVLIRGGRGLTDTLFTDSLNGTQLAPNDSVVRFPPSYLFSSNYYLDGDNIVVVWPQARIGGIPVDSLMFNVYFLTIQSIHELQTKDLIISPNPGTDFIKLGTTEINHIEYVRIYNTQGKLIYQAKSADEVIHVKSWTPGIYFIELGSKSGKHKGRLLIQ